MKKRKQKQPIFHIAVHAPARQQNEGYGKVKVIFKKRRKINVPTMLGI